MPTLLESVREQKRLIETAKKNISAAESEIFRLQQTCKHTWRYSYYTCPVRGDSFHEWTLHLACDACDSKTSRTLYAPPCKVHLVQMQHDKIIESLPAAEGQRNRGVSKIRFCCKVAGCTETTISELWDTEITPLT